MLYIINNRQVRYYSANTKYFVLLNDDYKGNDIDKWYCQTIISEENSEGNPVKPFLDIETVLKEMRDRTYNILSTYIKTKELPEVLFDIKSTSKIIEDTIAEEGLEQFTREVLDHLSVENYMKIVVISRNLLYNETI